MAQFKRIMVGLDFTDMDKTVLEYTKMMAGLMKPEVIYFVHAEEDLDFDEEMMEELGLTSSNPADEELDSKLKTAVNEYFQTTPQTEIVCQVVEGSPFKEMLHWSHIKHVDLLVVGKKKMHNGKGVLPQKLTRKIDASVLFVPEGFVAETVDRILLPIDFSKNSRSALETTDAIFSNNPGIKLICANCFSLPLGWYKTGKTEEQFMTIMRQHSERKFKTFMENLDLHAPCEAIYSLDPNNEPSEEIMEMALRSEADLIVIGARGKTDAATVILGSTTEKLLAVDKGTPLMVIKKKGQTLGFLDALFSLK